MDYENLTPQYRIEEYLEAIVSGWVDATKVAYPEVPSWRIEEFLDAFITYIWEDGDHPRKPCPEPVWRLEECLRAIYDVMTGAATPWAFPTPTNRIEEYLAAIHAYLADGTELPVPEPVWRIEQWLAYVLEGVKEGGGIEKTVSGSLVHITNALAKAALSVLVSIEPIQDLHGYSHPWPGGGGKNKYSGGDVIVSNTLFADVSIDPIPAGTYTISAVIGTAVTTCRVAFRKQNGSALDAVNIPYVSGGRSYATITLSDTAYRIYFYYAGSTSGTGSQTYTDIQIESGSSPTSFSPYSNICPISGRTGLSVYVSPTQDPDDATVYNVEWTTKAGTVYHGTVDPVAGQLTVDSVKYATTWGNYSGSTTLNACVRRTFTAPDKSKYPNYAWTPVSNILQYSADFSGDYPHFYVNSSTANNVIVTLPAGTSDDTSIEVVYELATPITYQLTAQEVQMLLGENYVWSSSGDTVSVTYYAEGNANPLQSLNILLGGNYSNPKTADDVSDKEALDIILGGNK